MLRTYMYIVFNIYIYIYIQMNSPQWCRHISCRPCGARPPVGQESPSDVQNTKICCGFFGIGFRFSDRRKYFGSLFWDLEVTLLIIRGEGVATVPLRQGWSSLFFSLLLEEELLSTVPCLAVWSLWVGRWTDVCWIHQLLRLFAIACIKVKHTIAYRRQGRSPSSGVLLPKRVTT